jgi:hypothetical protein
MSTGSSQFGDIFISHQFDTMVEAFIQKWIDTYLSEIELRLGYDRRSIDRPKSYNAAIDVDHWPEEKLPGILVVSAGITDPPERFGGSYAGWWDWAVIALLTGRDYDSTRLKTGIYQAAMRAMFAQKSDLDGAVSDTIWLGEPTDFAPVEGRDRTRGVAAFQFRSWIEGLVDSSAGPTQPDPGPPADDPGQPHDDWPTVQTVDIDLTKTPLVD